MRKKHITIILTLILVFSSVVTLQAQDTQDVKNPNTITYATLGNQSTLDPHYAYDTDSVQVIFNVLEGLIQYDGSKIKEFKPMLSTKVPSKENGLISEDGTDYTFIVREGVKFTNGNKLTPEDVKYSIMRGMVYDRTGGPMWMLYEPLFGLKTLDELSERVVGVEDAKKLTAEQSKKVYNAIDEKIEINGNKVTFHLDSPYPPFLNVLAHGNYGGLILDKEWSIKQGCWPDDPTQIAKYHDRAKEDDPLFDKLMGTGPFMLESWQNGEEVVFRRNDDYWREPANFETAIIKNVDEWSTRKMMFLNGDADLAYVPKQYRAQVANSDKVRVIEDLANLANTVMTFNWDINTKGNAYVGSGKLDGEGIPSNFFDNLHVRKAFSYAFNYDAFIQEVRMGEAIRLRGPIVKPLIGYDKDSKVYKHNVEKAKEHFKKAFDGKVWENGFKMTLVYNTGNPARKVACDIMKAYVEQINPKFDLDVRSLQWSSYLEKSNRNYLPLAVNSWIADYPDPHNFVSPYLSSNSYYGDMRGEAYNEWAEEQGLNDLIDKGINTLDDEKREKIYKKIQKIAVDKAVDVWLDQSIGVHVERSYLEGYYPNAMRPGVNFYIFDKPGGLETHEVKQMNQ